MDDPRLNKHRDELRKLQNRKERLSEAMRDVDTRRDAFFDRLALLNAGALTFSATLLSNLANRQHTSEKWIVHLAWGLMLIALGSCLVRNVSHQHYRIAELATRRAESEIAVTETDSEVIQNRPVVYSDSTEAFDRDRELELNKSNAQTWRTEQATQRVLADTYWRVLRASEWTAAVAMFGGFLLMVVFAVLNT